MSDYLGKDIFKLGFGMMRLPKDPDGKSSVEETARMADAFLEAGGIYFDTAYAYGDSEETFRKAVAERHPRDSYLLCTKLVAWLLCTDEESAKHQFYESLERTGAGYFDFYLCHSLQAPNYEMYDKYHIWDFIKEQKAKGLIKHFGFSFHDQPDLLEKLLTEHPEVDYVQLQINYADWENPGIEARKCYEIARKHNKPVTVMEPVKGGLLADPIPAVKKIFDEAAPGVPYTSWAIRFAASLDGIITVLSGMSSYEQMVENLSFMKDFKPLTEEEQKVIRKAQDAIANDKSIACTGCHYCTKGCPMNVAIPEIFAVKNRNSQDISFRSKREYRIATENKGKASDCIECGQCEFACPQHLKIIDLLKDCRVLED